MPSVNRSIFSAEEKRNLIIYILGIVLYKFGLEAFNGSIITLATNRFDRDALQSRTPARTFEKVGYVTGLNQALQCIGSILIAPLIKHFPTRTVLSIAIFIFAIFAAILIILDAATGGSLKPRNFNSTNANDFSYYGEYKSDWIIVIFGVTGIAYGTVESIHRVIPCDIVGRHVDKLQQFDALVHMFYATSGAVGAFVTGLVLIPKLGNNQAFIITPILFCAAGMVWLLMSSAQIKRKVPKVNKESQPKSNSFQMVRRKTTGFVRSIFIGATVLFTNRKYVWFFACYSLGLYAHRYLEDAIAPQVARRYLGNSAWAEIIIGGSNFGEFLGSFFVLFFATSFRTPLPWLRISALLLLIVWYIPYCYPPMNNIRYAWLIALTFVPISFGWAASDIALAAHIQSSMTRLDPSYEDVSILGAVMSFLYSSYIIIYAIANPFLGKYIDHVYKVHRTIRPALVKTVGVQFTLIMIVIFASTLIPSGAFALNPTIDDVDEKDDDGSSEGSEHQDGLLDQHTTEPIST